MARPSGGQVRVHRLRSPTRSGGGAAARSGRPVMTGQALAQAQAQGPDFFHPAERPLSAPPPPWVIGQIGHWPLAIVSWLLGCWAAGRRAWCRQRQGFVAEEARMSPQHWPSRNAPQCSSACGCGMWHCGTTTTSHLAVGLQCHRRRQPAARCCLLFVVVVV
jgi:hypothetical protein